MGIINKLWSLLLRESSTLRLLRYKKLYPGLSISPFADIFNNGTFEYEHGSDIQSGVLIEIPQNACLRMGSRTFVARNAYLSPTPGSAITIAEQATVQERCVLTGNISIGRYTLLAPNVYLQGSNGHFFNLFPHWLIRDQDRYAVEKGLTATTNTAVVIEEDCWIGINTVITSGVRIGKGSIIGANSVVTKDIPPYSIVAGAPAKVLKPRMVFDPPEVLDSAQSEHLPYFYEGFKVEQAAIQNSSEGIVGYKDITIALANNNKQKLCLALKPLLPNLEIQYAETRYFLNVDEHIYEFPIESDSTLFSFTIICTTTLLRPEQSAVSLKKVWCE